MVSTRPFFPSPPVPLLILWWQLRAPITIGIIITFMFHSFFNSQAKSRYLSLFSHSFTFTLWSARTPKSTILQVLFFIDYYKIWSSGWGLVIRLNLKILRSLCVSFSRIGCAYTICSYGQISISLQFPVGHFSNPVVSSRILFLN